MKQWAQSQNAFFLQYDTLTNYLYAAIVAVGLLGKFMRGGRVLSGYPTAGWLMVSMFIYCAASYFWALAPNFTIEVMSFNSPYIVLFALAGPLLVWDDRDAKQGFYATLALGSVILLLLLLTSQIHGREILFVDKYYVGGRKVDRGNPLAIATMASYVALIGVLMNFRGVARIWQILRWGVVGVAFVLVVQSGSRGQLFGTLLAGMVFYPMSRRIRNARGFLVASIGLLVLTAAAGYVFNEIIGGQYSRWQLEQMQSDYESGRLKPAIKLMTTWLESSPIYWIIGLGSSASWDSSICGFYPHFVPAEVLAEEGIIGFAMWCAIIYVTVRSIIRLNRVVKEMPEQRGLVAAMAALFLLEFLLCFKTGTLLGSTNFFAFSIILGRMELSLGNNVAYAMLPADAGELGAYYGRTTAEAF